MTRANRQSSLKMSEYCLTEGDGLTNSPGVTRLLESISNACLSL